jgi:tetratricopeptide (TPR) repeat protein
MMRDLFDKCVTVAAVFCWCILGSWQLTHCQDDSESEPTLSLRRLGKTFSEYQAEFDAIARQSDQIMSILRETEKQLGTIQDQTARSQLNLMSALMEQQSLGLNDRNIDSRAVGITRGPRRAPPNLRRTRLPTPEQMVTTQNWIKQVQSTNQLASLSATQQTVVKSRIQAFENYQQLRQQFMNWQSKWTTFWPKYWAFTDPEGYRSRAYIESAIEELKPFQASNPNATLALGILYIRIGNDQVAKECLEPVIAANNSLSPIALAAKAWLGAFSDKSTLTQATKFLTSDDSMTPYAKWILAQGYIAENDHSKAIRLLEGLVTEKSMESAARRQVVLLQSVSENFGSSIRQKNLKLAALIDDLAGPEEWYPKLLHAVACYCAGQLNEAKQIAETANEIAKEDNILTSEIIEAFKAEEPLDWKFFRHRP